MKQMIKALLGVLLKGLLLALIIGSVIGIASFFMTFSVTTVLLGAGLIVMCIGLLSLGGNISGRTDMRYLHARSSGSTRGYEYAKENLERFEEGSNFAVIMGIAGAALILVSVFLS